MGSLSPSDIAIVPSVLPADFSRLGEDCRALTDGGADRIQWDVMDNHFVPNLTFGASVIEANRGATNLPFEAHLMIEEPEPTVGQYVDAGCELVIVHAEACRHLHSALGAVADAGGRAAVALNPATPASAVAHVLDLVDLVLVMTVNPGFGGQSYLATMEPKIAEVAAMIRDSGRPIAIEIDGGVSTSTVGGAVVAGARSLVAGSALFKDPEGIGHAIDELRTRAHEALRSTESAT
ncbi:MAG: ribulose-phosphate 3-epimerase [Actinomycetota bacterium]|nr:ribulose-phosphate 3-epimerase [Actinomycetota bacterium]